MFLFLFLISLRLFFKANITGLHTSPNPAKRYRDWFNQACNCVVRLKTLRRPPNRTFRNRSVQITNQCSLAIQKANNPFVYHKRERLASSATGSPSFWSLPKAISCKFFPSNFPRIRNSLRLSGMRLQIIAPIYVNCTLFVNSTYPPCAHVPNHASPSVTTTRKIRQVSLYVSFQISRSGRYSTHRSKNLCSRVISNIACLFPSPLN